MSVAGGKGLAGKQPLEPKFEHDWRRGETRLGLVVVTAASYLYDFWNFLRSGVLDFYTINDLVSLTRFIGTEGEFAVRIKPYDTGLPGLDRTLDWFFSQMGISNLLLVVTVLVFWLGYSINRKIIQRCDRINQQIAVDNLRQELLRSDRETEEDIRYLQNKQKDLEKYLLETIQKIRRSKNGKSSD